jgi:ribonuclease HI
MNLHIYTDGGARGNPGISGYGVVVLDDNRQSVYQESKFLGIKTNNEAEYYALISALTWLSQRCQQLSIDRFHLYLDSQLIARQITGAYKIKAEHLKPLYQAASRLLDQINLPFTVHEIPRSQNSQADKLANQAMDQHQ